MNHQGRRQAVEIGGQVLDVLVAQRLDLARHDGVVAAVRLVAPLVGGQRMFQVVAVLAGQFRIGRVDRRGVVLAVAGGAAVFFGQSLARIDIAGGAGAERDGGANEGGE